MALYTLDINDTTMIQRQLNVSFDKMAVILPDIEKTCLNVGANILKEKVQSSFTSKMPSASRPVRNQTIGTYKITTSEPLVDAVRQSKVDNAAKSTKVHILGANKSGSSQFIARFYENGTKDRYQTKIKGKTLKKKRWLGKLTDYHYFMPTVQSEIAGVASVMGSIYSRKIDRVLNDG